MLPPLWSSTPPLLNVIGTAVDDDSEVSPIEKVLNMMEDLMTETFVEGINSLHIHCLTCVKSGS